MTVLMVATAVYDIAADQSAFNALPAARAPFHHWANLVLRKIGALSAEAG